LKRDTDIIAIRELMQADKMPIATTELQGVDWEALLKNT
jgi:hypothetical protein